MQTCTRIVSPLDLNDPIPICKHVHLSYFPPGEWYFALLALASNPLCRIGAEEKRPSVQEDEELEEESNARHDLKASASRRR